LGFSAIHQTNNILSLNLREEIEKHYTLS